MAIVDLGTFELEVGDAIAVSTSWEFNRRDAYPIVFSQTLDNPNNVFSQFEVDFQITNDDNIDTIIGERQILPIQDGKRILVLFLSRLFGGNGDAVVLIRRTPLFSIGSGSDTEVTLNVSFDDSLPRGSFID